MTSFKPNVTKSIDNLTKLINKLKNLKKGGKK